jgi:hypothetical protein
VGCVVLAVGFYLANRSSARWLAAGVVELKHQLYMITPERLKPYLDDCRNILTGRFRKSTKLNTQWFKHREAMPSKHKKGHPIDDTPVSTQGSPTLCRRGLYLLLSRFCKDRDAIAAAKQKISKKVEPKHHMYARRRGRRGSRAGVAQASSSSSSAPDDEKIIQPDDVRAGVLFVLFLIWIESQYEDDSSLFSDHPKMCECAAAAACR